MSFLTFLACGKARRDSRKPSSRCEWYMVLLRVHLVLKSKRGLPKNTVRYIILFLTWWFFSFIFFKTIRRISGKRLIKIRRIIASHVETEVSIWANTKYILCCFKKGLKKKGYKKILVNTNFPRRSEWKVDSDETISSNASLSDGDGYSLHRNTLSILLPTHLLPSTPLVLEDCPVTLHDLLCIFHICFISGWGGVWILLLSPILLLSLKDKLFTLSKTRSFYFNFGLCYSFWFALDGGNPETLGPSRLFASSSLSWWWAEPTDASEKRLINNWWQGSQSSCCLALT